MWGINRFAKVAVCRRVEKIGANISTPGMRRMRTLL
jgi:hypothetical protein